MESMEPCASYHWCRPGPCLPALYRATLPAHSMHTIISTEVMYRGALGGSASKESGQR